MRSKYFSLLLNNFDTTASKYDKDFSYEYILADMWSVGAILCEMFTDKILFKVSHCDAY